MLKLRTRAQTQNAFSDLSTRAQVSERVLRSDDECFNGFASTCKAVRVPRQLQSSSYFFYHTVGMEGDAVAAAAGALVLAPSNERESNVRFQCLELFYAPRGKAAPCASWASYDKPFTCEHVRRRVCQNGVLTVPARHTMDS